MNPTQTDTAKQHGAMVGAADFTAHWKTLMAAGIVVMLIGVAAIAAPLMMTLIIEQFIGWMLVIVSVVQFVHAFESPTTWTRRAHYYESRWVGLLIAAISLLAGFLLIMRPVAGMLTLTVLLAAYFLVQGICQVLWGIRTYIGPVKTWLFISGAVSLVLGGLIWFGLPSSANWAIGLLVGINFLFSGSTAIAWALAIRQELKEQGRTPSQA